MNSSYFRLILQLSDGEYEVRIGEWLVSQCEVPPLGAERIETVSHHCCAKYHAVFKLLFRNLSVGGAFAIVTRVFSRFGIAAEIGVTFWSKPIECAAHI